MTQPTDHGGSPSLGRPDKRSRLVSAERSPVALNGREEEREMISLCLDMGAGVIPWSPRAREWLTGSRSRHGERHTTRAKNDDFASQLYDESDFDVSGAATALAAEHGLPPA